MVTKLRHIACSAKQFLLTVNPSKVIFFDSLTRWTKVWSSVGAQYCSEYLTRKQTGADVVSDRAQDFQSIFHRLDSDFDLQLKIR